MSVKYMDIKEFVEKGFLQEANRMFFHPLGLALEIRIDEQGAYALSGIWDYREDPEGIVFDAPPSADKAAPVEAEFLRHLEARKKLLGGVVQPLGEKETPA